jgi:hypothetical protein
MSTAATEGVEDVRRTAAFLLAAATTAFALMAGAATGHAGLGLLSSCGYGAGQQAFAGWGDDSDYVLAPGGTFEGSNPWKLAGGAQVVPGNEPFYLNSLADSHSLFIPAGGSATSVPICLGILDPTLRLVGESSDGSPVHVDIYANGVLGLVKLPDSADIDLSSSWNASSVQVLTLQNLLALTNLGTTSIVLRFSPTGSASVRMDDVYVDPIWHE